MCAGGRAFTGAPKRETWETVPVSAIQKQAALKAALQEVGGGRKATRASSVTERLTWSVCRVCGEQIDPAGLVGLAGITHSTHPGCDPGAA
jgi:hypothetical protein